MQTLPVLCLLAAFIASGASLLCETCKGSGDTCKGPLKTCPPGYDTCGILHSQSTGMAGLQAKITVKACLPASYCVKDTSILNLGSFGTVMVAVSCCTGDDCSDVPPALPPAHPSSNGRTCPACFSLSNSECQEETVSCAGDEIYCLELTGTATDRGKEMRGIVKGCSNAATCSHLLPTSGCFRPSCSGCKEETASCGGDKSYCFDLTEQATAGDMLLATIAEGCASADHCNHTLPSSDPLPGICFSIAAKCSLASGTASATPGLVRLCLQALAGILLVKILR